MVLLNLPQSLTISHWWGEGEQDHSLQLRADLPLLSETHWDSKAPNLFPSRAVSISPALAQRAGGQETRACIELGGEGSAALGSVSRPFPETLGSWLNC
jgi:hypothetical protein